MAEWIEVLLGSEDPRGTWSFVLDRGLDPPMAKGRGSPFNAAFVKLLWPLVFH